MNKDRLSFTAGFLPAVSLAILMGFDYASKTGAVKTTPYIYALTEGAAFLFPFVILLLLMREGEVTYRFKGSRARFFPLSVSSREAFVKNTNKPKDFLSSKKEIILI